MTIQRYQITEEACRKHCVDKVCIYCGEPIEPIETVDNSGNPTFWTACMKCSRFNPGTTKEIYRKALSLREGVRTIPVEILVGIVSILCNDNLAALAEKEEKITDYEKVIKAVKLDSSKIHELVDRQAEEIAALKAENEDAVKWARAAANLTDENMRCFKKPFGARK